MIDLLVTLTALLMSPQDLDRLPINREPVPAAQTATFEARCASLVVRLRGYGLSHPQRTSPSVTLNGVEISGPAADSLRRELSRPRAAYRLVPLCHEGGRGGAQMQLLVYRGEQVAPDQFRYELGEAYFSRNRLIAYEPMRANEARGFFYY